MELQLHKNDLTTFLLLFGKANNKATVNRGCSVAHENLNNLGRSTTYGRAASCGKYILPTSSDAKDRIATHIRSLVMLLVGTQVNR